MTELDPDFRRGDELWPYFVQHNRGNKSLHTAFLNDWEMMELDPDFSWGDELWPYFI